MLSAAVSFRSCYRAPVDWHGSWRSTCLQIPLSQETHISCTDLFSDLLYRPFYCAQISLLPYTASIPIENRISRLKNLTRTEFTSKWVNTPFILTEPVKKWPIYDVWSIASLLQMYGDVQFRAEAVDWPLRTYVQYMNVNNDESPLYLFDQGFVEKMSLDVGGDSVRGGDYWAPECFGEDLFEVLGDQRPDSRWLIVGPERSGSTFHKDPNATR